ncbi:DUF2244 domain-containing protein [Marivivens marinus]|uniref:DUF2244 domain-containing protein n=1 Tax=Marivivens marinus TaxID=3110173 RepID=UPI003B8480C2
MPYEWTSARVDSDAGAELHLWPYRSLPKRGFVIFIGLTAGFLLLPLLAVVGSLVLWGLLPFLILAVAGVWWGLGRSYRDGELVEALTLTRDRIELVRQNPRGPRQSWEANPYWVQVRIHPHDGPVPDYLTLKGGDREVEIGSFLTPEERRALYGELHDALRQVR